MFVLPAVQQNRGPFLLLMLAVFESSPSPYPLSPHSHRLHSLDPSANTSVLTITGHWTIYEARLFYHGARYDSLADRLHHIWWLGSRSSHTYIRSDPYTSWITTKCKQKQSNTTTHMSIHKHEILPTPSRTLTQTALVIVWKCVPED